MINSSDMKATRVSPALVQPHHMITVLYGRCLLYHQSSLSWGQCSFLKETWTSFLVSSCPKLTWAHLQSNVSFCFVCGLPSGNSITKVSSLVLVNGSFIKSPYKYLLISHYVYTYRFLAKLCYFFVYFLAYLQAVNVFWWRVGKFTLIPQTISSACPEVRGTKGTLAVWKGSRTIAL